MTGRDTIREVSPRQIWREEALVPWCELQCIAAKPLHVMGHQDADAE